MTDKGEQPNEVDPQELSDDEAANVEGGFNLGDYVKLPPIQDQMRRPK
ncbi:MAG: hypothetical protein WC054_09620 [Candidatus Nanopelagicales bacterium]